METLVPAAGATLGFAIQNLPGAYTGYQIGKEIMAYRKRKAQRILPQRYKKKAKTYVASKRNMQDNFTFPQKQASTQYVKRNKPKYLKKKWKKFVKKVRAATNSDLDFKTVVFNTQMTQTNIATDQGYMCLSLYGNNGYQDGTNTVCVGYKDLWRIKQNESQNYPLNNPPSTVVKMGKLHFDTAVIDVTLRNLSASGTAEVDIYEVWSKRDINANTDLLTAFNAAPSQPINELTPNATVSSINQRGMTLFDKGPGISATGIKITSKRKLILPAGQHCFLQKRLTKNQIIQIERLETVGCAVGGLTFHYVIVWKSAVGIQEGCTLGVGVTRKYSYGTKFGENIDRSAVNPTP